MSFDAKEADREKARKGMAEARESMKTKIKPTKSAKVLKMWNCTVKLKIMHRIITRKD